jgi:hypothetical protein
LRLKTEDCFSEQILSLISRDADYSVLLAYVGHEYLALFDRIIH